MRRVVVASVTAVAVLVTAAPAQARAAETRRARNVTVGGHWWDQTSWSVLTTARSVRGSRDSGRVCARRTPKTANVRIYAYDARGRRLAALSRDRVQLGCLTLTAPRSAVRFVFRVNVTYDASGERSWGLAATR